MSSAYKKRRGTAIVDTKKGILVVAQGNTFLLPGGAARHNELQIQAAIRELKEETGIYPFEVKYLFRYLNSKIFFMRTKGTPRPCSEINKVDYYYPGKQIPLSYNTKNIIKKYYLLKNKGIV